MAGIMEPRKVGVCSPCIYTDRVQCSTVFKTDLFTEDPPDHKDIDFVDDEQTEGHAFCELCDCVQGFHSEEVDKMFVGPDYECAVDLICNVCDMPIVTMYGRTLDPEK